MTIECKGGARHKPLPLRRGFWRKLPQKIREGTVLLAETLPEREDVRNAAQAILIDHIEPRLMARFQRPVLSKDGEFYAEFFSTYQTRIYETNLSVWEEIGKEVDAALRENPARELTEKEAAFLTIAMLGHPMGPQGYELYMNLASYARAYEELLREKHGEAYIPEIFYRALRAHMPKFLLKLISMDALIGILLTMNAWPRDLPNRGMTLKADVHLDARFMDLGEDDSFSFAPKFIEVVHEHAREKGFREDPQGRTEDRGCPVLYTSQRDTIICFAIEELIAQHRHFFRA